MKGSRAGASITSPLYFCFFCSGLSGLIYQVVWVRMFGNVFGNTISSASIVVAVFMLGLGVGSYAVGRWADRRYAAHPESLLRAFGGFELAIGVTGLALAGVLPHLGRISALASSYTTSDNGWLVLSVASHAARAAMAILLLTPITLLMGGTLTLLIRYLVRTNVQVETPRIAVLYAVNTAGAAAGAFLTDFALVPAAGLRATQLVALFFNLAAAGGALALARHSFRLKPEATGKGLKPEGTRTLNPEATAKTAQPEATLRSPIPDPRSPAWVAVTLALSGFAAMGFEILWFRHFTVLLGGFRAVFALLLTIILGGIAAGSLVGALWLRRTHHPVESLMAVQALFVVSSLAGVAAGDASGIREVIMAAAANAQAGAAAGTLNELWFNAAPILLGTAVPALLMGLAFPLGNAIVQRAADAVGHRAGMLYLANTAGAVCGSLATGFLLLPALGIQGSAGALAVAAALALLPLWMATRPHPTWALAGSALIAAAAVTLWLQLPPQYVVSRTLVVPGQARLLTINEGITEVVAVTETPGEGRTLFTNGHPMSSTEPLAQRYMRALAHIPLLSMDRPQDVLVIGFGVGNTAHAATLYSWVRRVDVVDLSRHVLEHAAYFRDTNASVLSDPRVTVHINDGRQHLLMNGPSYDLITLEPPPIVHAGVAALYSREFYRLARQRLKPGGFLSQWLPVYQVPETTALAMARAFLDVFPNSVLLSGAQSNLLLLGTTGPQAEIDPARVEAALSSIPAVRSDLQRLDLGTVREIVGTFIGAAATMAAATRDSPAVTDDRPIQEYSARSLLNFGTAAPSSVIDLSKVAAWCPDCFIEGRPIPAVAGLDTYLALLDHAYSATSAELARTQHIGRWGARAVAGSAYLGATVPESAETHGILGAALRDADRLQEAIEEFETALRLEPGSARIQNDLGITLAMQGKLDEAIARFEQAVEADSAFDGARQNLATARRQQSQRAAQKR